MLNKINNRRNQAMTFVIDKNPKTHGRFMPMFDEVFNDLFRMPESANFLNKSAAVNIREEEGNYYLEFSAPGYEKDEFKIGLENQVLTVSAQKKEENKVEAKGYTRREFAFPGFKRSFNLPESVNGEAIKAEYRNGILYVNIPKRAEEAAQKKEIIVE